jgi:protein subunit release factor A
MLDPKDLVVKQHPPSPKGGMQVPNMSRGIRVEHIPTGCAVECTKYRTQHENRRDALALLELLVE